MKLLQPKEQAKSVIKAEEKEPTIQQTEEERKERELMSHYHAFLDKYGGLGFTKVKFRPGAAVTTTFGLDVLPGRLGGTFRIHLGIDRGNRGARITDNPIYCPFATSKVEWHEEYGGGYGSLLRLITPYGFEVRIAHIEQVEMIKDDTKPGELVAYAGNKGMSTAIHTHTEIVSTEHKCSILEETLAQKYGKQEARNNKYTKQDAADYMIKHGIQGDYATLFNNEITRRRISFLNRYLCRRIDYHTGKPVTFYSSYELFGM